jgi:hypothetical protein
VADEAEEDHFDALIAAWDAWDRQPGSEGTALKFGLVCAQYAKQIGWTTNELRTMLAAGRRRKLDKEDVVTRLVGLWA